MECTHDVRSDVQVRVCWFCKKGRHAECMVKIPTTDRTDGPHDCAFDTVMIRCECTH